MSPGTSPRARGDVPHQVLRAGVNEAKAHLHRDLDAMQKSVEGIRPFIAAKEGNGSFADAVIHLNRAAVKVGEWSGTLAFTEEKCR